MKLHKPTLSLCLTLFLVTVARSLYAQQIAYDDAGNYRVNANWTNGANQGFGFVPWAIFTNGPDFHNVYVQSANNPTFVIASVTNVLGTNYNDVWGLFANGPTDINLTSAFRGFSNPLGTNTFKLQWGSQGAGSTATTNSGTVHGWCGFTLRHSNATNSASDFQNGVQMYLYFLDGNSPSTIYFWDGNGVQSVPGTSFSNLGRNNITNAIEAEVTPASDGVSYHLVLKDCVQNAILFVTNSIFMSAGATIDSAALFCQETTGDQVYNRMQITAPTNIPPTISNLQPADGSLYLTNDSVSPSFEVDSFNSTVSSSTVAVYLNQVLQTGLTFNTPDPTNRLLVSFSPAILPDTFYNYTIVATDAYGNTSSNNYTFNTFLPGDIYIDASDYNFAQGQFVNTNTPVNAYSGLLGTNFVDYQIADLTGTNNTAGYRSGDLVEILPMAADATGDPVDHASERAGGFTVYNIGFTDTGNWENYTRVYPTAYYSIYARAASASGGQFEVEKLANPTANGTNQPLIALGRVNVANTGGSKVYAGQLTPVTDFFGNTVVLPLSGTNTLRETSLASRVYNLEYFDIVGVTSGGTLRPYIATGSPAPNATGALLSTGISVAIANRQTSVISNTVKLILNSTNVSRLVIITNFAGATVSWTPTNSLPANFTNTVQLIFTDSSGTSVTNSWTFVTGTSGGVLGAGIWSGAGGTNDMYWADGINWTGGTPGPGFSASFTSAGATTTLVTNNIVGTNVTILQLNYETNLSGYHTTWIQDGVTLTVTNGTTATGTQAMQVGGGGNGVDNVFSGPVTNTITGARGTLVVTGNPQGSGAINSLNLQVRQNAANCPPRLVTLDMSGLGTLLATVGKFYVAQGGSGANQTNVSGCALLARTNIITCLRLNNAGVFEVGDSSGGPFTLPGSALFWGITNSIYADTIRFGKQKATNNLIAFNPAFTAGGTPAVLIRDTNGPASPVSLWSIGDADTEATVPDYAQANVDFSGGTLDARAVSLILARGSTSASDTGFQQGTLTFTAGNLVVSTLSDAIQRAANTAVETGTVNVNGTATLISTNIVLALSASGGNASLVTGSLNVTNGTVEGNIVAGGGNSLINLSGGALIVSNFAGTAAARISSLNLLNSTMHLAVNGSAPAANVNVAAIAATGATIAIDSVANVAGPTVIHLINYTGSDPFAGLSLALPPGYTGSLADNAGSVDLSINVGAIVPPGIHSINLAAGKIVISGSNNTGSAGGTYHLLSATNLLVPLSNWVIVSSGSFDSFGNFSTTNGATNSQQFFILKEP